MLMALSRGADGLRLRRQRALSAEVAVAGLAGWGLVGGPSCVCGRAKRLSLRLLLRSDRPKGPHCLGKQSRKPLGVAGQHFPVAQGAVSAKQTEQAFATGPLRTGKRPVLRRHCTSDALLPRQVDSAERVRFRWVQAKQIWCFVARPGKPNCGQWCASRDPTWRYQERPGATEPIPCWHLWGTSSSMQPTCTYPWPHGLLRCATSNVLIEEGTARPEIDQEDTDTCSCLDGRPGRCEGRLRYGSEDSLPLVSREFDWQSGGCMRACS